MNKQVQLVMMTLGNPGIPLKQRSQQLVDIICGYKDGDSDSDSRENYKAATEEIFNRLVAQAADENTIKKQQMLDTILKQLKSSPLRPATFIQMASVDGSAVQHAMVTLDNGDMAYIVAHDQNLAKGLCLGDRVMIDSNMKMLVNNIALNELHFGPESRMERIVDNRHIEVVSHQDERSVVMASPELMRRCESGDIKPGSAIVLGANGRVAIYAVPVEDKMNFRFLDRSPVPDVIVDRDIGSPPQVIYAVANHVREEMTRPELRRKFKLRPCITRLLCGVSGTGKTLAVQATHRMVYEVISEVTGTPIEKLPPRVFRFKTSQVLSMWLGESDKNMDRIFDEVESIAGRTFTNEKGQEFNLPVLVVMEEADGMGRSRGASSDAIYDRIMTTMLQRLDPNRSSLANKLIIFLSTTNEPHIIDPAMLRRIGGSVETFGRIDEKGFTAILGKHVEGLPARNGGGSDKKIWKEIIGGIRNWMFDPKLDPGVVELTYQGCASPVVKYRRDFLTGALIDRAVQESATRAWEDSIAGDPEAGVTFEYLLASLNSQVLSVANQLVPANVGHYLDIPDNVRVTGVKRIAQKEHANK